MSVDPITTEVIASRLGEITATMAYALYHSGYSPILRESKDGSSGLTDAAGRVVMIGGGLQYHLMGYQQSVQAVLERYPLPNLRPSDSFVLNDPYKAGNSHAPDMMALTPAFRDGALIGWGVSCAHKADIGGLVPGSSGAAAREIFHDGLLLPAVRFQTSAGIVDEVDAIIRNNSRIPDVVLGDLRAQVGSTRIGVQRLDGLCTEYGAATVREVMDRLIALTRQRTAAELALWQDGTAESEGFLDHDGAVKDRPVCIHVVATKSGNRLRLDFSASAPQTAGPVNVTTATAQAVSLQAVLAATDPTIPLNSGVREAVDFVMPPGLVVSPVHPATVNHYFPTAHVTYNCVLAALGQLNPARAVAPSGLGTGAITVGYRKARTGKPAVLYEIMPTALGGTSRHDGTPIIQPMNHFTPGAPVEIVESEYPIRVRRFDIWRDSAGAGRYRGGFGYIREFEVLEDSVLTVRSSNHRFPCSGHSGGLSPKPSRAVINPGRPDEEVLGAIETRPLAAGSVIRFERSGGGGFGPPTERAPEAVREDVRNGYVSPEAAREIYGLKDES